MHPRGDDYIRGEGIWHGPRVTPWRQSHCGHDLCELRLGRQAWQWWGAAVLLLLLLLLLLWQCCNARV